MDTSEQYIKMCEKAGEIQKEWKPSIGDYHFRKYTVFGEEIDSQVWGEGNCSEITILHTKSSMDGYWVATNTDGESRIFSNHEGMVKFTSIWLPRQDQLQEMVPCFTASTLPNFKLIRELNFFYDYWDTKGIPVNFNSWEQLWLAFAMKEKYNKKWKDEAWWV